VPYNGAPMLMLAVDTSSSGGSAAMLREERIIGSVSSWSDETYSSRMFRQVDFLLRELQVELAEVDLFAVASGPGSFTGLRVGIAAVKAWGEAYGKPVAGISALEAIAAGSRSGAKLLVPVIAPRRGVGSCGYNARRGRHVGAGWVGATGEELASEGEHLVATPTDFFAEVRRRAGSREFAVVTPTPEVLSSAMGELDKANAAAVAIEAVPNILAPAVGLLARRRAGSGAYDNSLTVDANYVRRSDAEAKWKA